MGWPGATQQGTALSFVHAFLQSHGQSTQGCCTRCVVRNGFNSWAEMKCSAASAVVDPGDSRAANCFGLSVQRVELCLKLLWCQKMGSPCAGKSSFSKEHINLNREKNLEILSFLFYLSKLNHGRAPKRLFKASPLISVGVPHLSGSQKPYQIPTQAFHTVCERGEMATKPSSGIKVIHYP